MDIVLILGNGFDLSLKRKTSIASFAHSDFWPFTRTTDGLAGFLTKKVEESPKWCDVEGALREYAAPDGPGSDDPFQIQRDREHFRDLNSYFTAYLQVAQQEKIDEESPANLVFNTVCRTKASSIVYTFNYTDVEGLVKDEDVQMPEVRYLHGKVRDYSIILGINDDMAVRPGYEFLYKSFSNYYASNELQGAMRAAREVVIFGHSLSEVDNLYFKDFLHDYLLAEKTEEKNVTVWTYDRPSIEKIVRNMVSSTGVDQETVLAKIDFALTNKDFYDYWDKVARLGNLKPSPVPEVPETEKKRSLLFLAGEDFSEEYGLGKMSLEQFPGESAFLQEPPSEEQIARCTDLIVFGIPVSRWEDFLVKRFLKDCMEAPLESPRKRITFITDTSAGKQCILLALRTFCEGNLSLLFARVELSILRLDGSDLYQIENLKNDLAGKPGNAAERPEIEVLAESYPTTFLPRIAEMLITVARRFEFTNEYRIARKYYQEAADAYSTLAASSKEDLTKRRVSVLLDLGMLHLKYDEKEDVYRTLSGALDMLPPLNDGNHLEIAPLRASCLLGIARMETREQKYESAIPKYDEAIAISRKLSGLYPDCFSPLLVDALTWYANMLCRQAQDNRFPDSLMPSDSRPYFEEEKKYRNQAEDVYREIQPILKGLYEAYPSVYAIPFGETHYDIGLLLLEKSWYVHGRAFLNEAGYYFAKAPKHQQEHILPKIAKVVVDLARAESAILNPYSHSVEPGVSPSVTEDITWNSVYERYKSAIVIYAELAEREPDVYIWDFFNTLKDFYSAHERHFRVDQNSFALDYLERFRALCLRQGNETPHYYRLTILVKYIAVLFDYAENEKARVYYEEAASMAYQLWKRDKDFALLLSQNLGDLKNYYGEQNEMWRFEFFEKMDQELDAARGDDDA